MCNYPNTILVTLKDKATGETRYTFDHWTTENGNYAVVHDMPSHETQLLQYRNPDDFEVIDRREWSL